MKTKKERMLKLIGTGSVTKTVLEFLKTKEEATLYTNEVDKKWVINLALKEDIPISSLRNKRIVLVSNKTPIIGWRYN
ncbi:hypothetical protein D3C74_386370 [compost metagenome]